MNRTGSALGLFVGGALQAVAIMLIAYAGLCACYMATTSPGAEFRPSNDAWIQVLVVIPGLALWFAGRWLMRRSSAAPPADPK